MRTKNSTSSCIWLLVPLLTLLFITGCKKTVDDPLNDNNIDYGSLQASTQSIHKSSAVATGWYKLQLKMILNASPAVPSLASIRLFGYSGLTLYESVRNGMKGAVSSGTFLYQAPALPAAQNNGYAWDIAANAALAEITRNLFPTVNLTAANLASIDSLEKAYNQNLTPDMNSEVATRSQNFGKAVAVAIFNWSKSDNFNHCNDPFTPPVFPGAWIPTPTLFATASAPYMGNVRPFLQAHTTGITPPLLFSYSEDPASDFYKMEKELYDASKSLTSDQKAMALFWNDVGVRVGYTPMGHVISIITQVLEKADAPLSLAAQAYAKAGMAMWDAAIVCWRSKYKYNLIRPVSYIQKVMDASWLPLIATPPHPEYPAAHAFITSAVMEAATSVLGNNRSFTDHTYDFLGYGPRNYASLNAAAMEAGISRFYGGIHYKPSITTGHQYGVSIGDDIAAVKLIK